MPLRWAAMLLLSCLSAGAVAQDRDDARRLLEQGSQRQAQDRERELLKDELQAERPTITIDGSTYTVEHTVDDLGRALYLSLQHRQWPAAQSFLAEYLALPGRDMMLVHYAQGMLARVRDGYREAEREYRALLALQPDFLPGRLELARTLFDDQQDREAAALFEAIDASIDADDPKTAGVRKTVATYRRATASRRAWNGAFSLGPTWNDNVNRTSASRTCLLQDADGFCYIDRQLPDAIAATGLDYDAALNKRLPLRGHHGLYLRALAFGQVYRDHAQYGELNALVQAGYSYRSARQTLAVAPAFDYYAVGNSTLFAAPGLHAEWSYTVSPSRLLKLEADWKRMRYRPDDYARQYEGDLRSAGATWFQGLGERWIVFAGADLLDSGARDAANAYLQRGARIGASLQWPRGWATTAVASYRRRDHAAYNPLLEARRRDDEQNYLLVVKPTALSLRGFVPVLTLGHTRVRSNVDWLYGYEKNTVSLKLERAF